jgi:hypothetical protein
MAGQLFTRIATPGWDESNPNIKLADHVKTVRDSITTHPNRDSNFAEN